MKWDGSRRDMHMSIVLPKLTRLVHGPCTEVEVEVQTVPPTASSFSPHETLKRVSLPLKSIIVRCIANPYHSRQHQKWIESNFSTNPTKYSGIGGKA